MSALEHFAARAAADTMFFGAALARHQHRHGLTDEQLAAELGCEPSALTRVRLCGMPRTDADRFAADCAAIAERFGLKVDAVTRIAWPW